MPTLTLSQTDAFTIAYSDANGAALVPGDGVVTLSSSDPAVATVASTDANATSGVVTPVASNTAGGTVSIVATGPNGQITLTGDVSYTITAAAPASGVVTAAPPTP
jgi:hypothetical protein